MVALSSSVALLFFSAWFSGVEAALNLAQAVEGTVLRLRDRVHIPDSLVERIPSGVCDSKTDGPHCGHAGLFDTATTGIGQSSDSPRRLLADGILSARLFASPGGGEMLDELMLRPPPAEADDKIGSNLEDPGTNQGSRSALRRRRSTSGSGDVSRGRSALLHFRRLEPWTKMMPSDFRGVRVRGSGVPFSVRWEGPWMLAESPFLGDRVVPAGRFAAELRGAVGSIHFGRPVHLQSIDLARPSEIDCLTSDQTVVQARGLRPPPPPPLVIRASRGGVVIFKEVVPAWELGQFVNGVAFFALTSTEAIDEVTFLAAECMQIGAIQLTFGGLVSPEKSGATLIRTPSDAAALQTFLITMRDGWRAYGWEEVEFNHLNSIGDAPAWNLNEAVKQRLTMRKGVFDEPPPLFPGEEEAHINGGETAEGVAPEPMYMAPNLQLQEVIESGPETFDPLGSLMRDQWNFTILEGLGAALMANAAWAEFDGNSEVDGRMLLRGVRWREVLADLTRLLAALASAAEGASASIVGAKSAGDAFDRIWRRLKLDYLDTTLIRWTVVKAFMTYSNARGGAIWSSDLAGSDPKVVANTTSPIAAHTLRLTTAIRRANQAIEHRVSAKNDKVSNAFKAGAVAAGAPGGFQVSIEQAEDGSGVVVMVKDGKGREAQANVVMESDGLASLMDQLDPKSADSTGSSDAGTGSNVDEAEEVQLEQLDLEGVTAADWDDLAAALLGAGAGAGDPL